MTDEKHRRPLILVSPLAREEADETPTHVNGNGNGHGPETPTDPPRGEHRLGDDIDMKALEHDTAMTVGLVYERQKKYARESKERHERLEGKVDDAVLDLRLLPGIRADAKLGVALGYESIALGHENGAKIDRLESGQQEILSLLRANQNGQRAAQMNSTKALQRSAASDEKSTRAAAEAAKAHEVAKRAEREAKAARDTSARASQSDIVLQQAGARLLDMTVETTVDRERGEARIELDERKANSLARRKVVAGAVGLVVFILTVLGVAFRDRLLGTSHQDHRPPSGLERTSP
jgi:hypothetical protein